MLNNASVEVDMAMAFSEILMSEDTPNKIKELRWSALQELYGYLKYYEELDYDNKLICKIAEKKIGMIMQIKNKEEKNSIKNI